jgi:hypothetical protein
MAQFQFSLETKTTRESVVAILRRVASEIEGGAERMSEYDDAQGVTWWELTEVQ